MPYAQLDDRFHSHPKVRELSLAARGLFATGLSYAACFLTDGDLPIAFVREHLRGRGARKAAEELVGAGLWEQTQWGYRMPGYLDYNRSREQVEADRESRRRRQAAHRERQRQASLPWDQEGSRATP